MKDDFDNITEILERNAREWPDDVALVEINPQEAGKSVAELIAYVDGKQ